MPLSIRKLGFDDQETLALLAREDADFDVPGRGEALEPLGEEAARRYLQNPSLIHWVAEEEGRVVGHMNGYILPLRAGGVVEFLLYEIGVRNSHQGRGVGKALVRIMLDWMRDNNIQVTWVIADNPGAFEFYRKCGFGKVEGTLTQMEVRS
jgi:ribosomal protein S18 acetylase RimI-like enzyme